MYKYILTFKSWYMILRVVNRGKILKWVYHPVCRLCWTLKSGAAVEMTAARLCKLGVGVCVCTRVWWACGIGFTYRSSSSSFAHLAQSSWLLVSFKCRSNISSSRVESIGTVWCFGRIVRRRGRSWMKLVLNLTLHKKRSGVKFLNRPELGPSETEVERNV